MSSDKKSHRLSFTLMSPRKQRNENNVSPATIPNESKEKSELNFKLINSYKEEKQTFLSIHKTTEKTFQGIPTILDVSFKYLKNTLINDKKYQLPFDQWNL